MGLPAKKQKPASKKPLRRPYCNYCKKRFTTTLKTAEYCNSSCKQAAAYLRKNGRTDKRLDRATTSAFFHYLAGECKRASTLQVLQGHTLESLLALYAVYKFSIRANGIGSAERLYHICHIYPSAGQAAVGMLFADNLVVAPALANQRHGAKFVNGKGRCLPRSKLLEKHYVSEDESNSVVIGRIVDFLGVELVEAAVVKGKVQKATRLKLLQWFETNGITLPAEDKLSTQHLQRIKAEHIAKSTGKATKGFSWELPALSPTDAYAHELERCGASSEVLMLWGELTNYDSNYIFSSSMLEMPEHIYAGAHHIAFNILHGVIADGAEELRRVLSGYIDL